MSGQTRAALGLATALVLAGCAAALRDPPPVARIDPGPGAAPSASREDVDALLAEGESRFAQRPDLDAVRAAQRAFLAAAVADETRVEGLLGLARASSWLVEHEAAGRERQVTVAIDAAQWCARRAPGCAACDYALAQALGQQARERPSTSHDSLDRVVRALERAAAADPALDQGGPDRVLALVHLRAPGWPLGPGDPEAGLACAERAVAIAPDHPPNQLVLAEALARNGRARQAEATFERALALAREREAAGNPDAPEWIADAERGRGRVSSRRAP